MIQNQAGQTIGAQMITAADGTAFTGAVTAIVTIDGGTQGGGGAAVHEGNGYHSYAPTQGETNGAHIAVTFTGTGAIPASVQVYTTTSSSAPTAVQIRQEMDSNSTRLAAIETDTQDIQTNNPAATATAVWAETATEPVGTPAWGSSTFKQFMEWAIAWQRNRITQSSGVATLRNDANTADISTATVSDNGTLLDRGESS